MFVGLYVQNTYQLPIYSSRSSKKYKAFWTIESFSTDVTDFAH